MWTLCRLLASPAGILTHRGVSRTELQCLSAGVTPPDTAGRLACALLTYSWSQHRRRCTSRPGQQRGAPQAQSLASVTRAAGTDAVVMRDAPVASGQVLCTESGGWRHGLGGTRRWPRPCGGRVEGEAASSRRSSRGTLPTALRMANLRGRGTRPVRYAAVCAELLGRCEVVTGAQ